MKIGIFGGSFDPIHNGHLLFADQLAALNDFDKIIFIPAQKQYMKEDHAVSFQYRCKMVQLAIKDNPSFGLYYFEDDGNTYTYNTLLKVKAKFSKYDLYFMAGSDIVNSLDKWYKAEELGTLCKFAFGCRSFGNSREDQLQKTTLMADIESLSKKLNFEYTLSTNLVESPLSSTLIRNRLLNNQSCRYMIPDSVLDYIEENNLYTDKPTR